MTETQRDILIGYLDSLSVQPNDHPKAEDLKAKVLNLFDSMQPATFRAAYLSQCRAALDNCSEECKRRLIADFSKVYYYFAAGEGLPIYMRYLRMFDVMTELLDYVKGGEHDV